MTTQAKLKEFAKELAGFAKTAESTLGQIEADKEGKRELFEVFAERMFAIRGTADQLQLPHISKIAGLGEEIAEKGRGVATRAQVRKCVGALWDALTTVKHLLDHPEKGVASEEENILVNRLEATLRSFGGARERVSADDIERLLRERG